MKIQITIPLVVTFLASLTLQAYAGKYSKDTKILSGPNIKSLPIHTTDERDLSDLEGPKNLIAGELVMWTYMFRWKGHDPNGRALIIEPYSEFIFSRHVGLSGWEVIMQDGVMCIINRPPHIPNNDSHVFDLEVIDIKGAHETIVLNRLGEPQQVDLIDGRKAYLYTREISDSRPRIGTATSTTSGRFDGLPYSETTEHSYFYKERMVYNPYSFLIIFDENNRVFIVRDLCTKSASWE